MNAKHVLAGVVLLAMAACGGGGGDSGTTPTNEPPSLKFQNTEIAVPKSSLTDLTVSASDPDNDVLTITWDVTRGTLSSMNSANTVMRWTAPSTAGADTILITASDGIESTALSVVMKVGTRITAPDLPVSLTKVNSPYILVPGGAPPTMNARPSGTTTIEAGVEILIATEETTINVLGELQANGTADEPIVIRPNNRTFKCTSDQGWWEGLRASTDDAALSDGFVNFAHVEIRDAKWGVRLSDNASALLQDCKIVCSQQAGVLVEGNGWLRAIDSRITDGSGDGIAIGRPSVFSLPDSVRIQGCNLSFNGNAGIAMDLNDSGRVVPIVVDHNTIEFNDAFGIVLYRAVFPAIHYSSFQGNGDQTVTNLYLVNGYPGTAGVDTLNADNNFWGATSALKIKETIRDHDDSPGLVGTVVDVSPWLTQAPSMNAPARSERK